MVRRHAVAALRIRLSVVGTLFVLCFAGLLIGGA
jgi:hypothetical protein